MENTITLLAISLFHSELESGEQAWSRCRCLSAQPCDPSLAWDHLGQDLQLLYLLPYPHAQQGLLLLRKRVPHLMVFKTLLNTGKEISSNIVPVRPQEKGVCGKNVHVRTQPMKSSQAWGGRGIMARSAQGILSPLSLWSLREAAGCLTECCLCLCAWHRAPYGHLTPGIQG